MKVDVPARIAGPDGEHSGKVTVVSPAVTPPPRGRLVQAANPVRAQPSERFAWIIAEPSMTRSSSVRGHPDHDEAFEVMGRHPDSVAHERRISMDSRQGDRSQKSSAAYRKSNRLSSRGSSLEDKAKVKICSQAGGGRRKGTPETTRTIGQDDKVKDKGKKY